MRRKQSLTPLYAAVQAVMWMSICISSGYAAVYLQALGYSNSGLGLILAGGSLCGAVLGLALSALIDADPRRTAAGAVAPVMGLQAAALLLLLLSPQKGAAASIAYVFYVAFGSMMVFLAPKIYVDLDHAGQSINFGVARGVGSLAYVLASALLGTAAERFGVRILPLCGLALCAMQVLFCRLLRRSAAGSSPAGSPASRPRGRGMGAFLRSQPRFCVLLLGMVLLFYAHNTVGNFMINIVRAVGGSTATMGYLTAFMAAVEIPVMLFYSRFRGRHSGAQLLRISFIFFVLKFAAIAAAPSVPWLFAAVTLQAPAFALEAVVIVDYVNETIPYADSAKAQSLASSMSTFGSVLASVVSGRLFDAVSVHEALFIAAAVCAAGAAIALVGLGGRARARSL